MDVVCLAYPAYPVLGLSGFLRELSPKKRQFLGRSIVGNCSRTWLIVPILTVNNSRSLQEVATPPFLGISGPNILEHTSCGVLIR